MRLSRQIISATVLLLLMTGHDASNEARAVEGAAGFYLLGSKGSMAGFMPPPGKYVQDDNYFYSGSASGGGSLSIGGNFVVGVDADAYYKIVTGLWVSPATIFGGNLALSVSGVGGWKDAEASATVAGGGGVVTGMVGDEETALGDPVLSAMLGWHQGNWHWNTSVMVNAPAGQWERGSLANIGFNRWAVDTNGAITYLAPTGFEVSAATGFTFNFENTDTNYDSGTEFHLEWAVTQHFSPQFTLGLVGYHYQQVTGDSGSGARLGSFKGRVTALGPMLGYNFKLGQTPVSTSFRYFKEFNAKNRLEGDAGFITFSLPLGAARK